MSEKDNEGVLSSNPRRDKFIKSIGELLGTKLSSEERKRIKFLFD